MSKHKGEFWFCEVCDAENHKIDAECQYCECQGELCKRSNCSDLAHFAHLMDEDVKASFERDMLKLDKDEE